MPGKPDVPRVPPERTHPYSVRMALRLGSNLELDVGEDDVRLPFAEDYVIRLTSEHTPPQEQAFDQKRVTVHLDAFPSASEAEHAGKLLTLAFLWFAAFKGVTVGFRKRTGDYLFAVRDRTVSPGMTMEGRGRTFVRVKPEELVAVAELAYAAGIDPPQELLISLEFFAGAYLEQTPRARFIALMTALEALAVQQKYSEEIGSLLEKLACKLEDSSILEGADNERLRKSLSGRLRNLRRESVRQAIVRLLEQYLPDQGAQGFVDRAYEVRSKMLHEGHRSGDLAELSHELGSLLRKLYAAITGLPLDKRGSAI